MILLRNILALGVLLITDALEVAGALNESSNFRAGLNTAAETANKLYFGTATNADQWDDKAYFDILRDDSEFGQITAANVMKWFDTEPEPGVFNFTDGDVIADFAKTTGKRLRGHNCVWYNQLPDWLSNGTFTAPELAEIVERHCFTLVSHYRGQVYSWDVINEPFNDDGTYRVDIFFNTLNTTYIPLALKAARRADPHTKLYINDFNIEGIGAKSTALKNLVKSLKAAGVPIDGVGIQSHLTVGQVPPTLQQNMAEFTALGVEVAITELDIRFAALPPTAAGLTQQRADYATVVGACNAVPGCVGITVWDFTDKYSWVPGTFPGEGAACPWDENYVKKPAYAGIIEGFKKSK